MNRETLTTPEFDREEIRTQYNAVLQELLEQRQAMLNPAIQPELDDTMSTEQQLELLTVTAEKERQKTGGRQNEFVIMQGASGAASPSPLDSRFSG